MNPFRLALLAVFWLCASLTHAAEYSLIEVPADVDGPALQGAVWAPATGSALPLVVISHGYGGSFRGHHDTAEALADAGFIVAAISHSSDNFRLRGGPQDRISALATRTTDMRRLIDYMLARWPAHDRLDAQRTGFFGFSRGGYTGLVLAGAQPDFERLPIPPGSPCATDPKSPGCAAMRDQFGELLATPLAHDARIKAAVIVDPFSVVFDAPGLSHVTLPMQLWASAYGGDGVTPDSVAFVRSHLPVAPEWHVADKGAHFGFLAPCTAAQRAAVAEICEDGPGFDRVAFHAAFNAQVVSFFQRALPQTH